MIATNVTADAAAICVKSGNAVILRGGKEAYHSSKAIVGCLADAAAECDIPENAVQLIDTLDRAAVVILFQLDEYIDVAIPRGGESLIRASHQRSKDARYQTLRWRLSCLCRPIARTSNCAGCDREL